MCEAPFPVWAMATFAAVVFVLGVEIGWALARINDLWHKWRDTK